VKKYLAVLFGVLFILSFSATAFAIHEEMPPEEAVVAQGPAKITLGGKIIVRGWYFDDADAYSLPTKPDSGTPVYNVFGKDIGTAGSQSEALYTYNAYLTVNAKISDNIQGFMELETTNNDNDNSGVAYPGVGPAGVEGTYDTKLNADMRFRQLWVMYTGSGLLGIPAGIKVGHMPISLGEKQFLNNERFGDDAILVWTDPTKEMHIVAGTVKLVDQASGNPNIGFINHTADLDGYVLLATYMLDKDNTIGANWTWAHSDGNLPSSLFPIPNVGNLNFHNLGVHAHGKVAGLSYAVEGDWQLGKATDVVTDAFGDTASPRFQGWGVFAKLGYMLDPVNLRASAAMGSGDSGKSGNINEFQTLQGTDATGAIARYPHYTLIYERLIRTTAAEAIVTTFPGGNIRSTGIANTTYLNLGFDVNPVKELGISVDGYWLRATKIGEWKNLLEDAGGSGSISKNAGWELDAKLNYKIAKNLTYFVEGGVFWPGAFYKDAPVDNYNNILVQESSFTPVDRKTVGMAVHGLLLEF